MAAGDVYLCPYGDGSEYYHERYRTINPAINSLEEGTYSNIGKRRSETSFSKGFALYRKLKAGEVMAAGGASSAGNATFARPTPLP